MKPDTNPLEGLLRRNHGFLTFSHAARVLGQGPTEEQARALATGGYALIISEGGDPKLIVRPEALSDRKVVQRLDKQMPDWQVMPDASGYDYLLVQRRAVSCPA